MLSPLAEKVIEISEKPFGTSSEYEKWISQEDFLEFLRGLHSRDEVILYAELTNCFLYGIAVPEAILNPLPVDDFLDWSCDPCSSWALCHGYRDGDRERQIWIESPLRDCGSKILESGEQLLFVRSFEGYQQGRSYVELSQKVAHLLGIHYIPERNAYCRLDDNGDFEDIVQIQTIKNNSLVVTIKREDMDMLLVMFKSSYVLLFDSTRFDPKNFSDWNGGSDIRVALSDEYLFYRGRMNPSHESYLRGFKIIKPIINDIILRRLGWESPEPNQYASFIAMDWKHQRVHECSCNPAQLGNYFVQSDFPYETSPAFFRPEVLMKYKADPDKYKIERRSIRCRGAWSLKSFDINKAGQVHAYLCDLNLLPYSEQIYWKSFNEPPKTGISPRAYKSDFLAEWDTDPDPLSNLKSRLESLNAEGILWWELKDPQLLDRVHYPVTSSQEEWATELMALDQLLIEGLNRSFFKTKAEVAGITVDPKWGSLKLIGELLKYAQINGDEASAIITPLMLLHKLRSKMKGHASGSEATAIHKEIIAKYGDLKTQFRDLADQCDRAIALMVEFSEAGIF